MEIKEKKSVTTVTFAEGGLCEWPGNSPNESSITSLFRKQKACRSQVNAGKCCATLTEIRKFQEMFVKLSNIIFKENPFSHSGALYVHKLTAVFLQFVVANASKIFSM
jgi:hypothetical protein